VTDIPTTTIDLVLTNVKESIHASGVIHLGILDHSLIYAVGKFMLPKASPCVREIRDYKFFDAELFLEDLSQMPWNAIQQFNNPNSCWNVWKSFFTETLNKHAPSYTTQKSKKELHSLDYSKHQGPHEKS